eukprot:2436343-Prymnesium_polylepis.1
MGGSRGSGDVLHDGAGGSSAMEMHAGVWQLLVVTPQLHFERQRCELALNHLCKVAAGHTLHRAPLFAKELLEIGVRCNRLIKGLKKLTTHCHLQQLN